ncbi:MAG TPA: hypothetical protein VF066_04665 [Thermoleophilaceae bacterium]
MAIAAEEAAPAWVIVIAFAVPVVIMLLVIPPALRRRAHMTRARAAERERLPEDEIDVGSAGVIGDPSDYSTTALLKALAVRPADYGEEESYDEGWAGTMLGLKSRISSSTTVLEPHVFWGVRGFGQVFIRLGPDEKIEGGTTMLSNKHVRAITVLRVDSPPFQLHSDDGTMRVDGPAPAEVESLIARLTTSQTTWSDARVTGGPDGIVASRDAVDGIEASWAYDLWLLEQIAERLALVPLRDARIGPAWKVPYGLGKSLTPEGPIRSRPRHG